jgi:hypothetical protein
VSEPDPRTGGDDRIRVAWEEGIRAVERQATSLDEARSRAGALLTAASIAAAFLGGSAVDDATQGLSGFTTAAWVGIGAFAIVGLCAAAVMFPVRGWKLHRSPADILREYVQHAEPLGADDMLHDLAHHLQDDYKDNESRLEVIYVALSASCVALVVEIGALVWDLRNRR